MDPAELLRTARRAAGLSQTRLAQAAGTSQSMVARYESGVVAPSVHVLARLLRAAGQELVLSGRAVSPGDRLAPALATLRLHRADILAAASAVGADNVRVFGSVARGEETPTSDADLLVDFPIRDRGLLPLLDLADAVRSLIDRHVDVATTELLDEAVRTRALAEAVAL